MSAACFHPPGKSLKLLQKHEKSYLPTPSSCSRGCVVGAACFPGVRVDHLSQLPLLLAFLADHPFYLKKKSFPNCSGMFFEDTKVIGVPGGDLGWEFFNLGSVLLEMYKGGNNFMETENCDVLVIVDIRYDEASLTPCCNCYFLSRI